MMDAIKSWAFSLCVTAVVGGITYMLVPKGNLENVFRVTVSAFLLISILMPLWSLAKDADFDLESFINLPQQEAQDSALDLQEKLDAQMELQASVSLKPLINEVLAQYQAEAIDIKTELERNEDGLSIKIVHIYLGEQHKMNKEEIKDKLEDKLKLEIDILLDENQGGG